MFQADDPGIKPSVIKLCADPAPVAEKPSKQGYELSLNGAAGDPQAWTVQSRRRSDLDLILSTIKTLIVQLKPWNAKRPKSVLSHLRLTNGQPLVTQRPRDSRPVSSLADIVAATAVVRTTSDQWLAKPVARRRAPAAPVLTRHQRRAAPPPALSPRASSHSAEQDSFFGSSTLTAASAGIKFIKSLPGAVAHAMGIRGKDESSDKPDTQPTSTKAEADAASPPSAPHSLWHPSSSPPPGPKWQHINQPRAGPASSSFASSSLSSSSTSRGAPPRHATQQRIPLRTPPTLFETWPKPPPPQAASAPAGPFDDGGWDATTTTEDWVDTELMCLRSLAESLPTLPAAALSAASGRLAGDDAAVPIGLWPVELAPQEQQAAAAAAAGSAAAQSEALEPARGGDGLRDPPALPGTQADVVLDDSSDSDDLDAEPGARPGAGPSSHAAALPPGLRGATGALLLRASDVGRLRPGEWLNDNAVEMAIRLTERLQLGPRARSLAHVMSTVFFSRLSSRSDVSLAALGADYGRVRRWTKRADVFSKTLLLVPVHSRGHWSLIAVINPAAAARRFRAMATVADPVRAGLADAEATMVQRGVDPEEAAALVRARAARLGVDTSDPMWFAPLLGRLPSVRVVPQARARVTVRRRGGRESSGSARLAGGEGAAAKAAAEPTIDLDGSDDGSASTPAPSDAGGQGVRTPRGRPSATGSAGNGSGWTSPPSSESFKSGRSRSSSEAAAAATVSPLSLVGMEELEAAAASSLGWREGDASAAECCIVHCDSLRAHNTAKCAAAVRHWLVREWERRRGSGYSLLRGRGVGCAQTAATEAEAEAGALVSLERGFTRDGRPLIPHVALRVPTQDNSCDCGVYTAAFGRAMLAVLGVWADAPTPPAGSSPAAGTASAAAAEGSASPVTGRLPTDVPALRGAAGAASPPLLPAELSTPACLFSLRLHSRRKAWPLEDRLSLDQLEVRRQRLDLALHMLAAVGGSPEARLSLSIPWAGPPAPRWEGRPSDAGIMRAARQALPEPAPATPAASVRSAVESAHVNVLDLASDEDEEEDDEVSFSAEASARQAKRARR